MNYVIKFIHDIFSSTTLTFIIVFNVLIACAVAWLIYDDSNCSLKFKTGSTTASSISSANR